MKLPTVEGSNLGRENKTYPQDFEHALNLVFVAFLQWQQRDVDSWVPLAVSLHEENPGLEFYEFPTIQKTNFLSRVFINEGMRAGIPDPETRRRTVTLYLEKRPFMNALDIPDDSQIQLFLLDQAGMVLWRESGPLTAEKAESLKTAVAALQPSSSP